MVDTPSSLAGPSRLPSSSSGRDDVLYSSTRAALYPSTHTGTSLLAVRFAQPVTVSHVRVYPEGVACPYPAHLGDKPDDAPRSAETISDDRSLGMGVGHAQGADEEDHGIGVGLTWPPEWKGTLFFNLSSADPVNAMSSSEVEYQGGEQAVQWDVGMPADVSTRLIILATPAEKLSLSIHGNPFSTSDTLPQSSSSPDLGRLSPDQQSAAAGTSRQASDSDVDWSFLSEWAGGVPDLINVLRTEPFPDASDPNTPRDSSQIRRALECLDLICLSSPSAESKVFDLLLTPADSAKIDESVPSNPLLVVLQSPSDLRDRLLADSDRALSSQVRPFLPSEHPLKLLVDDPHQAWDHLTLGNGALKILHEAKKEGKLRWFDSTKSGRNSLLLLLDRLDHLLRVPVGQNARRADVLPSSAALKEAGLALSLLDPTLTRPASLSGTLDPLTSLFARRLPPILLRLHLCDLLVSEEISRVEKTTSPALATYLPPSRKTARLVLPELAELALQVIWSQSTLSPARDLAKPYREYVDQSYPSPSEILLFPELRQTVSYDRTLPVPHIAGDGLSFDERKIDRFASRLAAHSANSSSPLPRSSLVHHLSPSSIVQIIAPDLYASLQTAAIPPLGIPPSSSRGAGSSGQGGSAAAWAGKVYSEHDFRNRDRDREGSRSPMPHTGQPNNAGVQGTMGGVVGQATLGVGLGGVGLGGGGGIGARGAEARPASRHVDDYVR